MVFNIQIWGALRDLVPFINLKNVKNTHGGVLSKELSKTKVNASRDESANKQIHAQTLHPASIVNPGNR